jgi:hypothetical protein
MRLVIHKIETFFIKTGEKGIAALWCGFFSLVLVLLFALSSQARARTLETTVNNELARISHEKKLSGYIVPWLLQGEAAQLGSWWRIDGDNGSLAVVFPVISNGIFAPYLGIIDTGGAAEFIPLSRNAAVLYERLSGKIPDVYIRRLQSAAVKVTEKIMDKKAGRGQ